MWISCLEQSVGLNATKTKHLIDWTWRKMSESKSEMSQPVGNLKNRIDNNLKLSIPKSNVSFVGQRSHPSTAPANSGRMNQFGDLPIMRNIMKNWDHNDCLSGVGSEDCFVTTPSSTTSSTISTPSTKRKHQLPKEKAILLSVTFWPSLGRTFTSDFTVHGSVYSVWCRSDKIYEVESDSARTRGESVHVIKNSNKNFYDLH